MTQMGAAVVAQYFRAPPVGIGLSSDRIGNFIIETRPSATGVKFVVGFVEGCVASLAYIIPFGFVIMVNPGEGPLCSLVDDNPFLFRGEGIVFHLFFMLLIIYYLLIDSQRLISFIQDLSPLPNDQDEKLFRKFNDMAGAILIGNGLCGLLQGVAGGIVFWIFGLKSAFLWGVIMGLLAFLPIIGVGVVFIPTAGYLILTGRIAVGIFFVVFYVILSGGVEYLLKPKLVGQRVKMHTLLVFLSIIGGLKLFGILGIIYGPLIITAFLTLTDIYYASYRQLVDPSNGIE